MMKRNICSIATFAFVLFIFWFAGLDFERGVKQAFAIFISLYVSGIVFFLGDWGRQK